MPFVNNRCLICPLQLQDTQVTPCSTSASASRFILVVDCERSKNFNPALVDFIFNLMQEERLAKKNKTKKKHVLRTVCQHKLNFPVSYVPVSDLKSGSLEVTPVSQRKFLILNLTLFVSVRCPVFCYSCRSSRRFQLEVCKTVIIMPGLCCPVFLVAQTLQPPFYCKKWDSAGFKPKHKHKQIHMKRLFFSRF